MPIPMREDRDFMERRKRVLFVIGAMSGGGAERQILLTLRLIDRTRFEPLLYLATREGELLGDVPSDVPVFAFREQDQESWWHRAARRLKVLPIWRYVHLAAVLRRERIDLVYDRTYRATLDAAGATWLYPAPRISCCVANPQAEFERHAGNRRALVWRMARSAYHRANRVLANSEDLRQRLIEYFHLPPDRVVLCRNLLDLDQLDRDPGEPTSTIDSEPFLIVTAGRLHPEKGFLDLLSAVDQLVRRGKSLRLIILGTGEQEAELREFVRSHQLQDHVILAGFVADPLPWFRKARLFVLSSLNEGSPNSLLEAVACGTPAVSTDCHFGPREILEDGRLGELVPPADPMAMASAIEAAMYDYPQWQQRAMMARESIRSRYDARIGIHQIEELFENVLRDAS